MASGGIPFGWKGPVVNFRSSVGPWRSWERASMASRRSWVRIPSAPPKKSAHILSISLFPRGFPDKSRPRVCGFAVPISICR